MGAVDPGEGEGVSGIARPDPPARAADASIAPGALDAADVPASSDADSAGRARWGLLAGVGAGVLLFDQLTKWWAVEALSDGHAVDLVWTLRFKLAFNTGSAFSLAQGRGALISLLALAVVAVLLRTGRHATRPLAALALGLVVGGALGNLGDRAFRDGPDDGFLGGAVVDFIDLQWWPVFNVADAAIVCGAFLLVTSSWRDERADDEPDDDAGRDPSPSRADGAV
jgi:signal peptidase II